MCCGGSVNSAPCLGTAALVFRQHCIPHNITYDIASLDLERTANNAGLRGCRGGIVAPSRWVVSDCFGSAKLINVIPIIINNRISLCFYKAR